MPQKKRCCNELKKMCSMITNNTKAWSWMAWRCIYLHYSLMHYRWKQGLKRGKKIMEYSLDLKRRETQNSQLNLIKSSVQGASCWSCCCCVSETRGKTFWFSLTFWCEVLAVRLRQTKTISFPCLFCFVFLLLKLMNNFLAIGSLTPSTWHTFPCPRLSPSIFHFTLPFLSFCTPFSFTLFAQTERV